MMAPHGPSLFDYLFVRIYFYKCLDNFSGGVMNFSRFYFLGLVNEGQMSDRQSDLEDSHILRVEAAGEK